MTKAAATRLFSVCVVFWGGNAICQTFEVASVKPADPDARGSNIGFPNGTFNATNAPARNLITLAFDIQPFQIEGAPGWVADQRFNVLAKMPDGVVKGPHDPDRLPLMSTALQALLADRFQLKVHRETKVMPAYVLVVARSGAKLKETTDDGRGFSINQDRGKLVAERLPLAMLARVLSGALGSAVVDQSGIQGVFDFTLQWTPDELQSTGKPGAETAEPTTGASIFTALQEQLGLRLEKQKAPVEMVVIDKIEKPAEN